jgi:hypothetical protein
MWCIQVNDDDLVTGLDVQEKPAEVMTDISLTLVSLQKSDVTNGCSKMRSLHHQAKLRVAEWSQKYIELAKKHNGHLPHHIIMNLSAILQEHINVVSRPSEFDNPRRNSCECACFPDRRCD